mgnify:CR=1 FL=1|jgi:hypothetical protein
MARSTHAGRLKPAPDGTYDEQRRRARSAIARLRWIENGLLATVLLGCAAVAASLFSGPASAAPWMIPLLLCLAAGLLTHCYRLAAQRRYDVGGVR